MPLKKDSMHIGVTVYQLHGHMALCKICMIIDLTVSRTYRKFEQWCDSSICDLLLLCDIQQHFILKYKRE